MHPLAYTFALLPGLLALAGLVFGGPLAWGAPLLVFGFVPLADMLWRRGRGAQRQVRPVDRWLTQALLLLAAGLDLGIVVVLWVRAPSLDTVSLVGSIISVGVVLGLYGLNVGHELGHRGGVGARVLAQILMGSSLYAHFWVEHNLGHHTRVATPDDPASARRGDWLFPFWIRSLVGGARSALALDRRRVVLGWGIQLAILALVAILSPIAALAWVGAAVVGILLLETVNYLEHYGLRRRRISEGRYERVRPAHSWNAEHPIGRAILFDLPRHADHHAHPRRACVELRFFDEAPQLPTGYPAMILLALVPPAFISVMDRALDAHEGVPAK